MYIYQFAHTGKPTITNHPSSLNNDLQNTGCDGKCCQKCNLQWLQIPYWVSLPFIKLLNILLTAIITVESKVVNKSRDGQDVREEKIAVELRDPREPYFYGEYALYRDHVAGSDKRVSHER